MPGIDLIDMIYQDGVENPSGLAAMHGIALLTDFAVGGIKKADDLNTVAATPATVGAIAIAHTFAAGKCMKKLYGTENKGESKEDEVGELDSQASKATVTIACPGLKAEYIAQKKRLRASQGLTFVTLSDGQVMQYGSERFPCHFKVSWASGNNEGYRGYTITATCYGDGVIYTPGLNFTPAV